MFTYITRNARTKREEKKRKIRDTAISGKNAWLLLRQSNGLTTKYCMRKKVKEILNICLQNALRVSFGTAISLCSVLLLKAEIRKLCHYALRTSIT